MNAGSVGRAGRSLSANRWRLALLAVWAIVAGWAIASHAMWRDELQAWLIARDATSLAGLLANIRYDGHPALWHLLLMPLAHLTADPAAMQALHYAIALSTVGLVIFLAPLSWLERLLFPLGYFMLFEYAVKSRSYALGCLLLMLVCALWSQRRRHALLMATLLALLANVHVLFLIVSAAALAALLVDRIAGPADNRTRAPALQETTEPTAGKLDLPTDLLAIAIVLCGWTAAVLTAFPPADSGVATGWYTGLSLGRLLTALGTLSALFSPQPSVPAAIAALLVIAVPLWLTWRSAAAKAFLLLSIGGIVAFYYIKFPDNGVWHRGPLFISWFAAVWLEREDAQAQGRLPARASRVALALALASQAWFGITAVRKDLHQDMSKGRDVAAFIRAKHWEGDTLAGMPDYAMATVVGYLGVPKAYFPQGDRWGSFTIWDKARTRPVDLDATLGRLAERSGGVILLIGKGTDVDPALLARHGFAEVARFNGAGVRDENYVLYRRP